MQGVPQISLMRRKAVPLEWLVRLPPAHSCILILFVTDIALLGDLISGEQIWFGPAYLLVICLATWCMGWRVGQAIGIGCMAATFLINGVSLYPHGTAELAGNLVLRFAAMSLVVLIIAGSRRAYLREWWLARTDPLTGAFNRQAFFELSAPLAEQRRWRLVLYADLDGLKGINDGQGHTAGDDALRAFAAAIKRAIRRDDLFARVGGDEFIIFMTVKDQAAARSVAERLHRAMNNIPDSREGSLSCSVGALIVPPYRMPVDELVRQADNLMYQAKLRGACLELEIASRDAHQATSGRGRMQSRLPYRSLSKPLIKPKSERREQTA